MTLILVVEDEPNLALGLQANLEIEGYQVTVAHTGEAAVERAVEATPDLVILDLMLPGIDGYEVLTQMRGKGVESPVLILSARAEEIDKVRGFRGGAEDYVTKPFGVMELLMRVKAILRRTARTDVDKSTKWMLGSVEVDIARRSVRRGGEDIALTPRAFELLDTLIANVNKVMTRHELLRTIWGYDDSVSTRTVDAHIAELRRKLETQPSDPQYILTVHKVGYRLRL